MSELVVQLKEHQKDAMRAKDKVRLGTIRMILSEVKQREIDGQTTLSDDEVIAVLTKMVKQRRDSVSQFESAGREDLAAVERSEISVIEAFLPQQLSADEIQALIAQAIDATGASGMQDMGKVMGILKPKIQGRAEMGPVSAQVKAQLTA
ncbi:MULTISPECIES: GatB/YqeY domain-containing protein [Corallincola]|uniref:GatB/YqeY domain-containing protein n=2 Tax=Corallincola TaxID=1775176 RepID=A0A368NR21_9GAMM|nr:MULTISPECIES: GatB/YqeY domain-containing protein [Corallincola]RCU51721.1 GatB/YqeY domain-containing protein [Corallincola holothuriorum]TAA47218.1 GatB/YqeY domain-containing protein [Corallincola spongiicola]